MIDKDININFRKVTYPNVPSNRYMISEDGKTIYDLVDKKIINQYQDKDGYYRARLVGSKTTGVNRLVAYEFCPLNRDLSLVVDHVDGNKQNNHYTNLEWVTIKENTNRAIKMGLIDRKGEKNNLNKYPESLIHEICQMFVKGLSNMEVLNIIRGYEKNTPLNYNKDKFLYGLIINLRKKRIWEHVTSKYNYDTNKKSKKIYKPTKNSIFNENEIHKICELIVKGHDNFEIAKMLNISSTNKKYNQFLNRIRDIRGGRSWANISSKYFPSSVGKSGRVRHDIDDLKLTGMLDNRTPIEIILQEFDAMNDHLRKRAIYKRINNYSKINNIPKYKDISLTIDDLCKLEDWAANW